MKVELTKFRVKENKSKVVDEWMEYINSHMDEVLITLQGERMLVETIFREKFDDREYLYWYSVQDDTMEETDNASLDRTHIKFFEECIDKTFRPEDMEASAVMMPRYIQQAMHYENEENET